MVLEKVRKELRKNVDKKYKENNDGFFKEKISCYGVRTPIVRKIGKDYFKEIKSLSKNEIFSLCEACNLNGVDYIKTSTGTHQIQGATEEVVRFISSHRGSCKIKASGGIKTWQDCVYLQ